MRLHDMNWMMVEQYLETDDRIVVPLGSTEQHAYLSLGVDAILSERVSLEAAEPLGVPVMPALPVGVTPYFAAYPGSPTVALATYIAYLGDIVRSFAGQGFRRILLVNGHGGNSPAGGAAAEWMAALPGCQVRFHDWWRGPRTAAAVARTGAPPAHASWMENLPWTRLDAVEVPAAEKPLVALGSLAVADPAGVRELLGDGSYGGPYQLPDEAVLEMWRTGVEEVRDLLENGWGD
jgi:creatinine amidohydrolase